MTELSTSGQDRRRLQNAMAGFSGGAGRGVFSEPPRRTGVAGARQSRVRRRALSADAPSVGSTRGKPTKIQIQLINNVSNHSQFIYLIKKCVINKIIRVSKYTLVK